MEIVHSGYVDAADSLTSRVGILWYDSVIFGSCGAGGGLGDLEGSDGSGLSFSGLGLRVGILDAVWDRVTARLLPRLGVLGGYSGFGVCGKSTGNGLLLDLPLIYEFIIQ